MGFKFKDRICVIEIEDVKYSVIFQQPLIDKLQKANIGSTHVYATACAYSLLLCLTSPNQDFTDDTGSTNTTDFIDTLCVARALLILGEYEKAYPYAKRVLKAKPYSPTASCPSSASLPTQRIRSTTISCSTTWPTLTSQGSWCATLR